MELIGNFAVVNHDQVILDQYGKSMRKFKQCEPRHQQFQSHYKDVIQIKQQIRICYQKIELQ